MNIETLTALAENRINNGNILKDLRQEHLDAFKKNGFREIEQDSYKFTNLASFFEELNLTSSSTADAPKTKTDFPTVTLTNGEFTHSEKLPEGVALKSISEATDEVKIRLKANNPLSHLHHGLLEHGVYLEIAKNAQVEQPIRLLHVVTKSDITSLTHLVVARGFSKFTLIEEMQSLNIGHGVISETYIDAQECSQVEHIAVHEEEGESLIHSSVYADVAKDASAKSFFLHHSGKMTRSNLEMNLNASGANGETYSLFLTSGKEHSDIHTTINHKSPDTTSAQIAKGILDGDSRGIFTGKIHIHPKAQRVASSQLNKNLLLSKKAQVHSQPQLEIFADDVKCSHGSTTGQLSPDEVFYFQARGIPEETARNLLAFGFGLEIVQKIQNSEARNFITRLVKEKLSNKFSIGRPS